MSGANQEWSDAYVVLDTNGNVVKSRTGVVETILTQDYSHDNGVTAIVIGPYQATDILSVLAPGSVGAPIVENLEYISKKSEGTLKVVPAAVMAVIQDGIRRSVR